MEGYGQTECNAAATITVPGETTSGHVGPPIPSIRVKLMDVPDMEYYAANNIGEVSSPALATHTQTTTTTRVLAKCDSSSAVIHGCGVPLKKKTGETSLNNHDVHVSAAILQPSSKPIQQNEAAA